MEKTKENQPSSSSMEVCEGNDDDKFKVPCFKFLFLLEEACIYVNTISSFNNIIFQLFKLLLCLID